MVGPHNQTIAAWGSWFQKHGAKIISGGKIKAEELISMKNVKGALKQGRRPDIRVRLTNGLEVIVQVGRVNAKGIPVKRELEAIHDFMLKGLRVIFIPYN